MNPKINYTIYRLLGGTAQQYITSKIREETAIEIARRLARESGGAYLVKPSDPFLSETYIAAPTRQAAQA